MICGVSYDKIRLGFEQDCWVSPWRAPHCVVPCSVSRRAKPTRDALVEALRASPVVYADETGWKQGGRRVWLWVFTNLRETVYEILPGRGFEQAASVLGKDGWAPYRCFKEATLQTCYNHLRATGDGHARGGALPTLDGHPSGTSPCAIGVNAEISACVCQGTPPGEDEPPAAGRFTNPERFVCDAIGTTSLCSSTVRTSFASPWSTARPANRERGTGPVDPHVPELRPRVTTSSRQSFVLPNPGSYSFATMTARFDSFFRRHAGARIGYTTEGFWDGMRDTLNLRLNYRINKHLGISGNYDVNWVDLPSGKFTTHLVSSRVQLAFRTDVILMALLQYNGCRSYIYNGVNNLQAHYRWYVTDCF